jgi:hypothetical protein
MAITKERSYYRMCPDSHLLEEARNKPNAELAAALGERLGVALEEIVELEYCKHSALDEYERAELTMGEKIFRLQQEVARNEDAIATMAQEIAYLKEQQND